MAQSIQNIVGFAVKATKANQLYLASLGEYLHENEDHEEIREALEAKGRDWRSDKMIAIRGWALVEDTGLSCPAMWAKGFLGDLKALAEAIGETESDTFRLGIKTFGEDLKAKDLRNWTPEGSEESDPMANIERAITMLLNETPKIDPVALGVIRERLAAI